MMAIISLMIPADDPEFTTTTTNNRASTLGYSGCPVESDLLYVDSVISILD
jgi:hypothetical protein